jgi:alkylation response protein AidB-like acyl-CoA dehydrogenase
VANAALQLHGGIGYTFEHDIHLYVRSAQVLAGRYGTTVHHKRMLKGQWLGEGE